MRVLRVLSTIVVVGASVAACDTDSAGPPHLRVEIVDTRPHDVTAFTEGFEVAGDRLLEGTGMSGASQLRASDLATGTELTRVDLPIPLFGEGITDTGSRIWQLTWRDGIAIERDTVTLVERRRVPYQGEGWGLCAQTDRLVMSNGTATLTFRDPTTFAKTGSIDVTGFPGAQLNELDCADDGTVYANAWPTDTILRIDPRSGRVTGQIDASGLLDRPDVSQTQRDRADVENGIAHLPGTDRFLITGKYWPLTFDVRFVE
ncbi:glutaminyl-peptide cyclotransferase [Antrihabitans cavernicola]|uniref:Glutaminyl-peptide cyclotransferase n=1 Tax=Antrihabitans cavernicola TaxID=2495913 RepID=A0A5A7S4W7_9NOCA|nr:glutaminyl-peptide cyclotransferase [Spelaeibacter cavernicola]KAA0021220.1 glutaminyl-peptide cyclotransferase [Spelaeibacter cavernicola]